MLKVDAKHFQDKNNFPPIKHKKQERETLFSATERAAKLHAELQEQEWL